MRLPHAVKQPVAADKAVAKGERILLVDLQPHKGAADHDYQRGGAQQRKKQRHYAIFMGLRHQAPPPFKVLCSRVSRRQYQ